MGLAVLEVTCDSGNFAVNVTVPASLVTILFFSILAISSLLEVHTSSLDKSISLSSNFVPVILGKPMDSPLFVVSSVSSIATLVIVGYTVTLNLLLTPR
ncbi:hypothetical protein D3C77_441350 [compost metagenome]